MTDDILKLIRSTHPLSNWWRSSEGNQATLLIELVEKAGDEDSYGVGFESMVFKIGDSFYKIKAHYSSYEDSGWDDSSVDIRKVTPKTRSVSYYD